MFSPVYFVVLDVLEQQCRGYGDKDAMKCLHTHSHIIIVCVRVYASLTLTFSSTMCIGLNNT